MTPKQRLNILLADDGCQHAQAAVEWLQNIPLPPKSRIFVFRAFHSGQGVDKDCSVLIVKRSKKE